MFETSKSIFRNVVSQSVRRSDEIIRMTNSGGWGRERSWLIL